MMRFVQFLRKTNPQKILGVLSEDGKSVVSISCYTNDMITLITRDPDENKLQEYIDDSSCEEINENITLLPPVTNPEKIICIGLNYLDHCEEQNKPKPKEPIFFSKFTTTLIGSTGNVIAPKISNKIDWEGELAVIIGREAKHVPKEEALDYVFGYSIAQDISARDWQRRNGGQFLIGKSMDTFCPLGPAIVHKCLIKDVNNLKLSTKVNGVLKQNSNTKNLIYKIDDIIRDLTQSITLKPGDVILTGTPGGVGMYRKPPEYLKPGDLIETEIESLGTLLNKVVDGC